MALRDLGNDYYACESDGVRYATIEVFYATGHDDGSDPHLEPGWYWWSCYPGCLPDGDANGPFVTEQEALNDAGEE